MFYVVSWIDVTENRHVGRRSHLRPKDTLAEVTILSHDAAEYIEHAQLPAMDYSNMLTAVAVRKNVISRVDTIIICSNIWIVRAATIGCEESQVVNILSTWLDSEAWLAVSFLQPTSFDMAFNTI